jgi:hypothetical protein
MIVEAAGYLSRISRFAGNECKHAKVVAVKKMIYLLLSLILALPLLSIVYAQEDWGLIRGSAFHDLDKDGQRDVGEPGLAGTVICLVGYNWCDHTEWGEFEFDMLEPGKYKVRLTDYPDGYRRTTRKQFVVWLAQGEYRTDIYFGLTEISRHGKNAK